MENLSKEQIANVLGNVIEMLNSQQPAVDTADVLIEALRALPGDEKANFLKRVAVSLTPTILEIASEFRYDSQDFSVDIDYDNRITISDVSVNLHDQGQSISESVAGSFTNPPTYFIDEIIDDL